MGYFTSVHQSFVFIFLKFFYSLKMNNFIWIALLPLLCPNKSTTEAWKLAESLKMASVSSSAHPSTPAQTNSRLNVEANHYGGIKKIVFDDPLKLVQEGKIKATSYYWADDAKFFARAFKKDFSAEDFGWEAYDCPQMLWCEFDDAKVPAGITFRPSQFPVDANKRHV